ncbi:hypothetical protein Bca52824_068278 [Brassica carinata]|uniref:Large ribosomal subunit protein uL18 C-terminal eukaryotes domain-containing protein n=1 Tax=Brassica carinata TaxID=52824 RepID=A0A8X7PZK7_BRACI|nr:hypothetical protein Bca52824_068278 [Brassica carinata]
MFGVRETTKKQAYFKRYQVKFEKAWPLEKTTLLSRLTPEGHSALLDVGLVMTTTETVFGALKGALDGGLDIPHSDKRFAGFNKEGKNLDAEVHRRYIYGGHVADYMKLLMEDEPEKYQSHFSNYLKKDLAPENMEEMYKNVHAAIRADPSIKKPDKEAPKEHKRQNADVSQVSRGQEMNKHCMVNYLWSRDEASIVWSAAVNGSAETAKRDFGVQNADVSHGLARDGITLSKLEQNVKKEFCYGEKVESVALR